MNSSDQSIFKRTPIYANRKHTKRFQEVRSGRFDSYRVNAEIVSALQQGGFASAWNPDEWD
jgi:hypothetical protein